MRIKLDIAFKVLSMARDRLLDLYLYISLYIRTYIYIHTQYVLVIITIVTDEEAPAQEFFHFFGSWPEPSLMRSYTTPRCEGKQLPGQEARESILLTSFALRNILSWVPL